MKNKIQELKDEISTELNKNWEEIDMSKISRLQGTITHLENEELLGNLPDLKEGELVYGGLGIKIEDSVINAKEDFNRWWESRIGSTGKWTILERMAAEESWLAALGLTK